MATSAAARFLAALAGAAVLLVLLGGAAGAVVGHDDDAAAARRTMEEFAGFPASDYRGDGGGGSGGSSPFYVDSDGLQRQIDELASFSDSPVPSVTRVLYSDKDVQARRYIKGIMNQLGLSIREDAVGNIFGRWEGSEAGLGAVATGSHVDAIPFSGKYDGVVGVLGALEAIRMLKRSGFQPKRSLEIIMFTSEEPTRFGISCLGSRLMAGSEELARSLKETVDNQNVSFFDAADSAGYKMHPEELHNVFLKKDDYFAFVELHIEQGPILEKEGIKIGVVTAIAAPASIKVEFEGNGGHAGAVLMPARSPPHIYMGKETFYRNDAGLAAAELALAVEKHVLESGSIDTVGTVGILQLHPGAINSIPSKSHVEIDVRDIDEKRRNNVIEKVHQSTIEISKNRGVLLSEFKIINQDPPALSDKSVISAMEFAAKQLNLEYKLMISRAYHDSLFMARISPMGMIFIPCYKGYSHKPEEYASPEDMANGVKVLALAMARLSLQ
uniref:Peptidase M20 dimerisation domain-containing protein n=1 Tax=Oryza rufipogon TaxID=4529 RepID=A0A0E0RJK5_ORYRU